MEQSGTPTPVSSEYSNDQVRFRVHFRPHCRVEFEVECTTAIVKQARARAVKGVGKGVTIAGFRKGKAPEALVESHYPERIREALEQEVSHHCLQQCRELCPLPVLNKKLKFGYHINALSSEDGGKLSLFFETEPNIPQVDPSQIVLKGVERPVVDAAKVEETIRQARLFFADWHSVEDRPVQEGDFVILNVDLPSEDPPRTLFSHVRFEVTPRSMAAWMRTLILGKQRGDILEGVSTPDEDAHDKEEFEPKATRVTILDIQTATIPEMDHAFAARLGVPSIEVLRERVENILKTKADAHVTEKLREEAAQALLAKYPFDVPASLVDQEIKFRMHHLLKDPEYMSYWDKMTESARKRVVQSVGEQAENAVRMFYLCRKILAEAGINVSSQDVPTVHDSPLHALLEATGTHGTESGREVHPAETLSRLILEKAEDYIIAHAKPAGETSTT